MKYDARNDTFLRRATSFTRTGALSVMSESVKGANYIGFGATYRMGRAVLSNTMRFFFFFPPSRAPSSTAGLATTAFDFYE